MVSAVLPRLHHIFYELGRKLLGAGEVSRRLAILISWLIVTLEMVVFLQYELYSVLS
jgi:hypothetical protein